MAAVYRPGAANARQNLEFVARRGCMAENTPFAVCRYAVESVCRVCKIACNKGIEQIVDEFV